MDNKTQRTVKCSMIMYDLGYKWTTLDKGTWMLHDEIGNVLCTVPVTAFPSSASGEDSECRNFTHKCLILLPSLYDPKNFSILFGIIKSMLDKYGYDFEMPELNAYSTPEEYMEGVINAAIDCIFEED